MSGLPNQRPGTYKKPKPSGREGTTPQLEERFHVLNVQQMELAKNGQPMSRETAEEMFQIQLELQARGRRR